jgi:tetratricopeptide (TPR) repeat protein
MTPWHRNEYILKGAFLGLWVFVALQVAVDRDAVRVDLPWVLGWVAAGLAVGLTLATVVQLRRGLRPSQNWAAFPLLVLLESPKFVYGGIVFGLAAGVLSGREFAEPVSGPIAGWFGLTFQDIRHLTTSALPSDDPAKGNKPGDWLLFCLLGGVLLGLGLYRFRQVEDPRWRFGMGIGVAALMVYLASEYVARLPGFAERDARFNLGVYILLGLPFFYLLTFCGEAEESEAEIMTICAALGIALHLMGIGGASVAIGPAVPFLLPVTIYFVYATRVLPGLRVFKHTLRGYSYLNIGRLREALYYFRRALVWGPNNALARQGMLRLHHGLTLTALDRDPDLIEALDFELCLDRAAGLLIRGDRAPTADERAEATRFLELVEKKKPPYQARVDYLRAVERTHARDYDGAATTLKLLLNPETPGYHGGVRKRVLFEAWNLAVTWHPEITKRVGWHELELPGRRVEAIGAVERRLAAEPQDSTAQELRTTFYSQLTEREFVDAAATALPTDFNYDYVEQLGLALVDEADPDRRERGMGYLHIAGRGLPARGPGIFKKLADLYEKLGEADNARRSLETAKKCGQAVGPGNLDRDQRDIYFAALRKLADLAEARGDSEAAIDDLRLYLEGGGRNELETYRKLAELYARAQGVVPNAILNAVLMVETGLTYNSTDADLLKKKDSYYYSVTPELLQANREKVAGFFDVAYCVRKAMGILNSKSEDLDLLDWATHLAKLATIIQPTSNGVRVVTARCLLRRGERDAGISMLEDVRESKKGSGDEEDSWYAATKILGQLYLDELNRPDLAVKAFADYQEYGKSGADTLYQLARSYEALGDTANAVKFYKAVTVYEEHPRYWDAKDALRRLGKE